MGFGFVKQPQETSGSNDVYKAWTRLLANKLRQAHPTRKISSSRWPDQFKKLVELDVQDPQEVENVLAWYVKHLKQDNTPDIHSAKMFRFQYSAIKKAMERSGVVSRSIELSKEAELVVKALSKLHWSSTHAKVLPTAVQISLDNYQQFLLKVLGVRDQLAAEVTSQKKGIQLSPLLLFVRHILAKHSSTSHFVEMWFRDLYQWIHRKAWVGNLQDFAMRETADKFQWMGADWAVKFSGSCNLWDTLLERIHHEGN